MKQQTNKSNIEIECIWHETSKPSPTFKRLMAVLLREDRSEKSGDEQSGLSPRDPVSR